MGGQLAWPFFPTLCVHIQPSKGMTDGEQGEGNGAGYLLTGDLDACGVSLSLPVWELKLRAEPISGL